MLARAPCPAGPALGRESWTRYPPGPGYKKLKDTLYPWFGRICNIVTICMPLQAICRFSATPTEIPMTFSIELGGGTSKIHGLPKDPE